MRNKSQWKSSYGWLRVCACIAVGLIGAQIALVLASWILTAAMPDTFWRSLLSAEGIRWFLGRFESNMASPLLVWLLLGSMAWGAVSRGGLLAFKPSEYRQRVAMWLVVIELGVFVAMILAMTLAPHAILLNVMGGLFPSSFSQCIIPYSCFAVMVMGVSFGVMSGKITSLTQAFELLVTGIKDTAPLWVLYLLGAQFYFSLFFVF